MRPRVIGRSARCLKARTRSTWRSNSCTGSSPWSWMSNGDMFLSSLTRLSRRQQAPHQDRYVLSTQMNKAVFFRPQSRSVLGQFFGVCLSDGLCQSAAVGFCSGHPAGGPQEPQWIAVSGGSRGCLNKLLFLQKNPQKTWRWILDTPGRKTQNKSNPCSFKFKSF